MAGQLHNVREAKLVRQQSTQLQANQLIDRELNPFMPAYLTDIKKLIYQRGPIPNKRTPYWSHWFSLNLKRIAKATTEQEITNLVVIARRTLVNEPAITGTYCRTCKTKWSK